MDSLYEDSEIAERLKEIILNMSESNIQINLNQAIEILKIHALLSIHTDLDLLRDEGIVTYPDCGE